MLECIHYLKTFVNVRNSLHIYIHNIYSHIFLTHIHIHNWREQKNSFNERITFYIRKYMNPLLTTLMVCMHKCNQFFKNLGKRYSNDTE